MPSDDCVRLYMDEDAGEQAVVDGLRARGIDVLTTTEAECLGSDDAEQLTFAAQQKRGWPRRFSGFRVASRDSRFRKNVWVRCRLSMRHTDDSPKTTGTMDRPRPENRWCYPHFYWLTTTCRTDAA